MEKHQQDILKKNVMKISENIPKCGLEDLLINLTTESIITDDMRDHVTAQATHLEKTSVLLNIVRTLGSCGFNGLYSALVMCGYTRAADILKPGLHDQTQYASQDHVDHPDSITGASMNRAPFGTQIHEYQRDRMPRHHEQIIQRHLVYLLDNVQSSELRDIMYERFVLDRNGRESIKMAERDGPRSGMDKLLDLLMWSGRQALPIFIECLRAKGFAEVAITLAHDPNI